MPDPLKQTVSASQVPALFGHSPYLTRFALWQHFANGSPIEPPENERMSWGKALQRVIVDATATQYRLDVVHNDNDVYERDGQLGCTVDAVLIAPDIGEIVVEAKNVDWKRWKDTWTESAAPKSVEIQIQTQLAVRKRAVKGVIACFVGGNDILFYERDRLPQIEEQIRGEAKDFFVSLAENRAPDPFGMAMELPVLAHLYPTADQLKVIETDDTEIGQLIRDYSWAHEQRGMFEKQCDMLKPKILGVAKDAAIIKAPGALATIKKTPVPAGVCTCGRQLRKAHVRAVVDAERLGDPQTFSSFHAMQLDPSSAGSESAAKKDGQ